MLTHLPSDSSATPPQAVKIHESTEWFGYFKRRHMTREEKFHSGRNIGTRNFLNEEILSSSKKIICFFQNFCRPDMQLDEKLSAVRGMRRRSRASASSETGTSTERHPWVFSRAEAPESGPGHYEFKTACSFASRNSLTSALTATLSAAVEGCCLR